MKFICLVLCVLMVCSCSKDEENFTGTIYGKVQDAQNGEFLPGVSVTLSPGGKSTTTGSDGGFEFRDLEAGQYKLQVQKESYIDNSKQISVVAGEIASGDIQILKKTQSDVIDVTSSVLNFGGSSSVLSFSVINKGTVGDVSWNITGVTSWMKVEPLSGTTAMGKSSVVTVSIDRSKITEDISAVLTINAAGGSLPVLVNASLTGSSGGDGDDNNQDAQNTVTNGLYAYYTFKNNAEDLMKNVNGVSSNVSYMDSYNGTKAFQFKAADDSYLQIPNGLVDQKNMSVSFWMKGVSDGHIFHVVKSNNDVAFTLRMENNALKFIVTSHHNSYTAGETKAFVHNNLYSDWHMITLVSDFNKTTYATTTTKLYIDGQYVDVVTESVNPSSESAGMENEKNYEKGTKFRFGGKMVCNNKATNATSMYIDNLRVYKSRNLSDSEVSEIYKAEKK